MSGQAESRGNVSDLPGKVKFVSCNFIVCMLFFCCLIIGIPIRIVIKYLMNRSYDC